MIGFFHFLLYFFGASIIWNVATYYLEKVLDRLIWMIEDGRADWLEVMDEEPVVSGTGRGTGGRPTP